MYKFQKAFVMSHMSSLRACFFHYIKIRSDKYNEQHVLTMTWFDTYNEFIKNIEKVTQLQKDYVTNLERINYLYNESIKNIERINELYDTFIRNYEKINRAYEQQFDNMQRMNQKWLDLFSKSWEQHQNEKR